MGHRFLRASPSGFPARLSGSGVSPAHWVRGGDGRAAGAVNGGGELLFGGGKLCNSLQVQEAPSWKWDEAQRRRNQVSGAGPCC